MTTLKTAAKETNVDSDPVKPYVFCGSGKSGYESPRQ